MVGVLASFANIVWKGFGCLGFFTTFMFYFVHISMSMKLLLTEICSNRILNPMTKNQKIRLKASQRTMARRVERKRRRRRKRW